MANPMYGQNKDDDALKSIALSRGYTKIVAGITLTGIEGGIIHIADTDACAIVLPTLSRALDGLEYKFIMANDAGGSITITANDSSGNYYQGTIAVHSVDADDGFAANGWIVWGNVLGTNATGATPFSGQEVDNG